ncbi:MAG: hypothetical protein ACPG44_02675 [Polaribacter sp.]
MGLDLEKLSSKEFIEKFDKPSVEEKLIEIPDGLIQFSRNKVLDYCLSKKVGLKDEPSPRVLVNWVDKNLVEISPEDKGKIKRFNKLESTWLNILVELRGFGLPLESLQRTRKMLFDYILNDFSLFKFQFLNTILYEPQTIVVHKDGYVRIMATDIYIKLHKKNMLMPHINLNIGDFIKLEYKNQSLEHDFEINDIYRSEEKMKLLYFLRTGDYQFMKVELSDGDVRYFENINMLLKSDDVLKSFSEWNFKEIIVSIDDKVETKIKPKT